METNKIWADGFKFELPDARTKEKAPWIKAKLSIRVEDAIEFLKKYKNDRGFVNIDIKMSKSNTYYMELNAWKSKVEIEEREQFIKEMQTPTPGFQDKSKVQYPEDNCDADSIPF